MPAMRRPKASRCVTARRSAPSACSTGMFARSVPCARFDSTGSATRPSVATHESRVNADAAGPCADTLIVCRDRKPGGQAQEVTSMHAERILDTDSRSLAELKLGPTYALQQSARRRDGSCESISRSSRRAELQFGQVDIPEYVGPSFSSADDSAQPRQFVVRCLIGGLQTGHGHSFFPASSNVIEVRLLPSFGQVAVWYLLSFGCEKTLILFGSAASSGRGRARAVVRREATTLRFTELHHADLRAGTRDQRTAGLVILLRADNHHDEVGGRRGLRQRGHGAGEQHRRHRSCCDRRSHNR